MTLYLDSPHPALRRDPIRDLLIARLEKARLGFLVAETRLVEARAALDAHVREHSC